MRLTASRVRDICQSVALRPGAISDVEVRTKARDPVYSVKPPVVGDDQIGRLQKPLKYEVGQYKEQARADSAQHVTPSGRPKAHVQSIDSLDARPPTSAGARACCASTFACPPDGLLSRFYRRGSCPFLPTSREKRGRSFPCTPPFVGPNPKSEPFRTCRLGFRLSLEVDIHKAARRVASEAT